MRACLILAVGLIGTSATVQQPSPSVAPQDKVVCKRVTEPDTGSHFSTSRRVCMKASDWQDLDDETQRAITRINNRGGVGPVPIQGMGGGPQ